MIASRQHLRFLGPGTGDWAVAVGLIDAAAGGDARRRGHALGGCCDHLGLVHVLAGSGRFVDPAAGVDLPLAAGDAFWRLPGSHHRNISDPAQPWRELWLTLPTALLPVLDAAGRSAWTTPVARIGPDPALVRRWERLIDLAAGLPAGSGDRLLVPALDLALEVVRRRDGSPEAAAVAEARRLLADPACAHLRMADLATRAGIGYHRLRRLFPGRTGRSLARWRVEQRIERACGMLLDPAATVATTAAALGWPSPQAFCRQFAAVRGETPGAWRRRMGR